MFAEVYGVGWLLIVVVGAAVFMTGNLNAVTATLVGFPIIGLIFGFMIGVLPWSVDKKYI